MSAAAHAVFPLDRASPRCLAIESSTDTLSVALGTGAVDGALWRYTGPGSAQASTSLLPQVQALLAQAGWGLESLDAVVFGRGPGSFTGLRTACAVAQGLAYGAQGLGRAGGLPVLPVDTLLALAEEARHQVQQAGEPVPRVIAALLDARMGELYVAAYACDGANLRPLAPARLCAPVDLSGWLRATLAVLDAPPPGHEEILWAGNAFGAYPGLLDEHPSAWQRAALPTAEALLRMAPGLLAAGAAVSARDALPLYVRDKVAQTTAERERARATAYP